MTDEIEAWVDQPFEHLNDDLPSFLLEDVVKTMDPGLEDGPPAETGRLQVDHAAATHGGWLCKHDLY